jgi:T5SS/PEP-CTERM-associated repeat protein
VTDGNLAFNSSHGTAQTLALGGVTVNLTQSGSGALGVGYTGTGRLLISEGVNVASGTGYLGYHAGSTGTAAVSGTGTAWTSSGDIYVGNSGAGSLIVTGAGSVANASYAYLGYNAGSSGSAAVSGTGAAWTSGNTLYVGYNGSGSLSVTDGAAVSSGGGAIGYNAGSDGTVIVAGKDLHGTAATWTSTGSFYVGNYGTGSLTIADGAGMSNTTGYVGRYAGAVGTVAVDGAGSVWTNSSNLCVGYNGTGKMSITGGGSVSNTRGYLGYSANSAGTVTVNGAGSTWTNSSNLYVGQTGTGKLTITGGGTVTASAVSIGTGSTLTADVGSGSSLKVGTSANNWTGTITNNGTIRLAAGAGAAIGTYTPITAGTWSDTAGTYQALGGNWDATAHTFTVNAAIQGLAGSLTEINLADNQRMLITDAMGTSVGMGFLSGTGAISLTASAITGIELTSLQGLLGTGQIVLSGWDFSGVTGYSGSPVYLSLYAGSGQSLSGLAIWHYDGDNWVRMALSDLGYDGTYASFTATDLSGWAVSGTAPVPIPAAVWLLGPGLAGLGFVRKRLSKRPT